MAIQTCLDMHNFVDGVYVERDYVLCYEVPTTSWYAPGRLEQTCWAPEFIGFKRLSDEEKIQYLIEEALQDNSFDRLKYYVMQATVVDKLIPVVRPK